MTELKSHRNGGEEGTVVEVGPVRFGGGAYPVIAGPGAIESETQVMEAAEFVAEGGAAMLRGDAYKPSPSPYHFGGIGEGGLELLARAGRAVGLPTVTEVLEAADVGAACENVDMLLVGADNMQNFTLLRAVGESGHPVLLKRGPSATIDEWLLAAEYILAEGNSRVVLCERGIRTFETRTRATLDLSAVPMVKSLSHLPVIVDPSRAGGSRDFIVPLALAGKAVGADGLMVEVHPSPGESRGDGSRQLDREGYLALMHALGIVQLRGDIDVIDREIVRLLARRVQRAIEIARIKVAENIPLRSPDRELDLLADVRAEGERLGLDTGLVQSLFEQMLAYSRQRQAEDVGR